MEGRKHHFLFYIFQTDQKRYTIGDEKIGKIRGLLSRMLELLKKECQ